ncbi:MAG TPA: hypothetical protein VMB19_12935 [Silvibacterium sp.]|nr:hypothetical protein [Silvibacterium sp.]
MNSARTIAAVLLLFGIAGCQHKVQSAAPPPPPPPVYPPNTIANDQPMPQPPPPKPVEVKPPGSDVAQQAPPPKPKKTPRHRKSTESATEQTAKESSATPPEATQVATTGQPPSASPIGQLTASDSTSTLTRQGVQDLIASTQNGLDGLKRALNSAEQQTATEIRTFLTKAKKALDQDDLDGANTLATKAKVLLEELTKS